MKMDRPHRVPLSRQALAVLAEAKKRQHDEGDHVFPSAILGQGMSNMTMLKLLKGLRPGTTVHGTARGGFRSWAEDNGVADPVAEMTLAHAIKDKVKKAYQRSDLLPLRTPVMQQWADFCAPQVPERKVVPLKRR
jgi:integrase